MKHLMQWDDASCEPILRESLDHLLSALLVSSSTLANEEVIVNHHDVSWFAGAGVLDHLQLLVELLDDGQHGFLLT